MLHASEPTAASPATMAALAFAEAKLARIEREPWTSLAWLPIQLAFLTDPAKIKLIRRGNQHSGKTTCLLTELLWHLLGTHPYLEVPPPPVRWWLVCAEAGQSVAVQQKLYDLCPKDEIAEGCEFDEVIGFRGRRPALRLRNGSVCFIKTENQQGKSLASDTLDGVAIDEPPGSQRKYTELSKRIMRRNGKMLIAMTPANAGDLTWLRDLCESGAISEHHERLTPESLIPVGHTEPIQLADGTPCDAAWVAQEIEGTVEYEREVACHGEWEYRATDRVFTAWRPDLYVTDDVPDLDLELRAGIDWGTKIGKQYAGLIGLDPGIRDSVWVLEETPETVDSTLRDDAKAFLAMLERRGLVWGDLKEVTCDRSYNRGKIKKAARDFEQAIATELGCKVRDLKPRVRVAKRLKDVGRHTVDDGIAYMHRLQVGGRLRVSRRCPRFLAAVDKWDGAQTQSRHTSKGVFKDSYYKDPIDMFRYALETRIFRPNREGGRATFRVY